jgi:hypothetical protein
MTAIFTKRPKQRCTSGISTTALPILQMLYLHPPNKEPQNTPERVEELWVKVPIAEYKDFYEVSNQGRIKSLERVIIEKTGKHRIKKEKIVTAKQSGNYLGITLHGNTETKRFYIHRLVAMAFISNPSNKDCVNHLNRDKHDNRASNLEWVTYKENTSHALESRDWDSPAPKGEACHSAKVTEQDVVFIRENWEPGQTVAYAKQFKVTHAAMSRIIKGITWRHVKPTCAIEYKNSNR